MRVHEAVYRWCGAKILPPPSDAVMRTFKIDQLRNGFVIAIDDCAVFGSVIDGEYIRFDGEKYWQHHLRPKQSKQIDFEWLVWEAGRVMIDAGIVLSREDSERLALAVKRLESWL